jgi:hypothetical protein
MKKGTYPHSSLVKTSHKTFEDPQNDKKEIENFKTSKYQNKIPSKFLEENQIPYLPPSETSYKKIKDPQNDRKKIQKTKNFQSSHVERHIPHFLICETSHKKS